MTFLSKILGNYLGTVYARYNGDFGLPVILRYIEILRYSYFLADVKGQFNERFREIP